MLKIDERAVFMSYISGKELDLGELAPSPDTYQTVLEEMVEIGLLVRCEELNTAYKVMRDFYFEGRNKNGDPMDQEIKAGHTICLAPDGTFTFVDASGEVFVAAMLAQDAAKKANTEEEDISRD